MGALLPEVDHGQSFAAVLPLIPLIAPVNVLAHRMHICLARLMLLCSSYIKSQNVNLFGTLHAPAQPLHQVTGCTSVWQAPCSCAAITSSHRMHICLACSMLLGSHHIKSHARLEQVTLARHPGMNGREAGCVVGFALPPCAVCVGCAGV